MISRADRLSQLNQQPIVVWFTGLSGSGKSTLARNLELRLHEKNFKTYLLDGDNIRAGLNRDLDYSREARFENLRRVAEVSKLFLDSGLIVLAAFISPLEEDRINVRDIIGRDNMVEVFVDCPISVCEKRDVKGLYRQARAGQIGNFTGISSPFERPPHPDLTINTDTQDVSVCVSKLVSYVLPLIELRRS